MFSIETESLNVSALRSSLLNNQAGAYASFEGWVRNRNDGRDVLRLEYEAHESMSVKEAGKILSEARSRFGLLDAQAVHRVGRLAIGDIAVWVGVIAEHRAEAFEACRYIIDEIKARVPIWKKEHYADGTAEWVNCQTCGTHKHEPAVIDGSGVL